MKLLPIAAVSAAAGLSVLALSDAVRNALAPSGTAPWDPADGPELILRGIILLHAAVYLLLAAVLTAYRRQIDGDSRALPWLRKILAACYLILGLPFCWAGLFAPHTDFDAAGWVSMVIFVAFLGSFVAPIPLGLLLLRQHRMRLSGWLLASPVIIFPLTIVLDSISRWGHPAYLESVVNLGTALMGVAAVSEHGTGHGKPAAANAVPAQGKASSRLHFLRSSRL